MKGIDYTVPEDCWPGLVRKWTGPADVRSIRNTRSEAYHRGAYVNGLLVDLDNIGAYPSDLEGRLLTTDAEVMDRLAREAARLLGKAVGATAPKWVWHSYFRCWVLGEADDMSGGERLIFSLESKLHGSIHVPNLPGPGDPPAAMAHIARWLGAHPEVWAKEVTLCR